jgi:hypothetical protein
VYTLDTNAIIYYLASDPQAVPVLEEFFDLGAPLYTSLLSPSLNCSAIRPLARQKKQ